MGTFSDIFIIYNPVSTGPGEDLARTLAADLRTAVEVEITLTPTEHAGHATELAFQIASDNERPLIISSSGDGGYNEVINGALRARANGADPVCAVLAAGNANDHSRTILRQPLFDAIVSGETSQIDVLAATIANDTDSRTRYAHSYIGLGLTPNVAVELNRNRLDRIKETYIVFKTLRKLQPVQIEVEGKRLTLDSLVMANIENMAKVLTIARGAKPDDGTFTITAFPYRKRPQLLFVLIKAALRGIRGENATAYAFRSVDDMPLQIDGEIEELRAGDEVDVRVERGALTTLR